MSLRMNLKQAVPPHHESTIPMDISVILEHIEVEFITCQCFFFLSRFTGVAKELVISQCSQQTFFLGGRHDVIKMAPVNMT